MAEKRAEEPKALIVCVSKHHGNTHRVAAAMGKAIDAEVLDPQDIDVHAVADYDLVGFGSGIYFGTVDPELIEFVDRLPPGNDRRVFTFSTSGMFLLPWLGTSHLRNKLSDRHYDVLGDFNCRGLDTVGLLQLIGGVNRGHPNPRDLTRAATFARYMAHLVTTGSKARSR